MRSSRGLFDAVRWIALVALVVVGARAATPAHAAPAGLVGAYSFDETSGTSAADSSGNGLTAALFGSPTWGAGHSGNALTFNGTSAYATVAAFPALPNWTVSLWVRSPAAPTNAASAGPVQRQTNFQINWNHPTSSFRGAAAVRVGSTWYTAKFSALSANTWYFLTASYDGQTLRTYTNGAQTASNTAPSGAAASDPNPLTFGKHAAAAQFFQGTVDDIRLYNRALSLAEIQSDMNTPVAGAADTTAPTVSITAPTSASSYTASSTPLTVGGTAADAVGVTQVSWANSLGGSGTATGTTSWTATGIALQAGSNIIAISARDAAGNVGSATLTVSYAPDTTAPTAPSNLTATAASSSQVTLAWTASTDAGGVTGYQVERCQGAGCSTFALVASPAGAPFSDTGLAASTSYSYRVRARDAVPNWSGYSNVATAATNAPPTGPVGLVAAYSFNENSGTAAADSSGNGLNAALVGGPTWVAGHTGSALTFNGTTAYGTVPTFPSLPNWSISAWVRSPAAPNGGPATGPIHRETNFQLTWNHPNASFQGAATVNVGGGWYAASFGPLAANTWYYLAATYDGETLRTYTNGALVTSNPAPSGPASSDPNPLTFGKHAAAAQFFTGTVDEVRIYSRALSLGEIQTDMSTPVGAVPPPDTTLPTVTITTPTSSPTVTVTASPLTVGGTASDNIGVIQVSWANSRGGSGTATGTTSWTASDIPLLSGSNVITITARDGSNNVATDTLTVTYSPSDTVPPTAPSNLTATAAGTSQVSLGWTASTDAVGVTGYQVERCQGTGCTTFALVASPTGTTYTDSGLSATTVYRYRVRAQDAVPNSSGYSNIASATTLSSNPAVLGQWSAPFTTPTKAVHVVSLRTGDVLMWDAFGEGHEAYLWNSTSGVFTYVRSPNNIFCSAPTLLPDGRAIILGGHADVAYDGIPDAGLFDPVSRSWSAAAPMVYPRWYPTAAPLGNGRVLVVSGSTDCSSCIAEIPEVYDPVSNSWTQLTNARMTMPLYPSMQLLPDGRVLYTGSNEAYTTTQALDVGTQTWTTVDPALVPAGAAVMFRPGVLLKSGSPSRADSPTLLNSLNTTYVLDMNQTSPAWRQVGSMAFPRTYHTNTVLPDGSVLVTSGTQQTLPYAPPVYAAEIWSPQTETWTTMASAQVPRSYHQTALLLADGRVLVAGSGGCCGAPDQYNAEIFSPPYLFKGPRPIIAAAPPILEYGAPFFVATPDAASIGSIALIRSSAVTHTLDFSQHFVPLAFTVAADGLNVQMPANANLAPPGDYKLFIVNSQGVPSVAALLTVSAPALDTEPPTAPASFVATPLAGKVQLTWTASVDNVSVDHYNVYRSTIAGFVPSTAALVAQPVSTTYTDQALPIGTYYYVVIAQDLAGNFSSPSNQVAASVANIGLLAAYGLEENGGSSAADSSGNGYIAILAGGPTWGPGHDGSALAFNGTTAYATVSSFPSLANWTLSAWVMSPVGPADGPATGPVHHDANLQITWNHPNPAFRGVATVNVGGGWYPASFGPLAANTWYYLTATYDGETLKAYTNGVLTEANVVPSGPASTEPNPLTFGKHAGLPQFFRGNIDNIRIYNRALSPAEIQSDMNNPVSGTP